MTKTFLNVRDLAGAEETAAACGTVMASLQIGQLICVPE
jgi:hypothetical protein